VPLPLPDNKGRYIHIGRFAVLPPETKFVDLIKANTMMMDILMEEKDRIVICGSTHVFDLQKLTIAHMVEVTPAIVKKISTLFQVKFAEPPLAINYP
jgi:hypothetical protein